MMSDNSAMRGLMFLPLVLGCFVTGCFPTDLDVNRQGELLIPRQEGLFLYNAHAKKVTKIAWSGRGQPAWACFDPSGKNALLAAKIGTNDYRFDLVPLQGGKTRTVFQTQRAGAVEFAPNGNQLALIRYHSRKPALYFVDVKTGVSRRVMDFAGPMVRWFADSKRLLVFRIEAKKDYYSGDIAILDTQNNKITPLAAALARDESTMDLSPDNRKVVFTANQAGAAGAALQGDGTFDTRLFELNIADKTIRELDTKARYVRYAPDGKRILLTRQNKRSLGERNELVLADAGLTTFKTIARDSFSPRIKLLAQQTAYPGWLNDRELYYFTERMVFGTTGKALHLVLINVHGTNKRFVQPDIDLAIDTRKWDKQSK